MTTLFVTQLEFGVSESDLLALFQQYGTVAKVNIIKDKQTNRSKGFGFVEMSNAQQAQKAIEALNGHVLNGRACVVKEAEKRTNNKQQSQSQTVSQHQREITPTQFPDKKATAKKKSAKNTTDNVSDGRNKKTKMNAYKKSSKNNIFISDEDELDELDLFKDLRENEIEDEDYRAYILNSNEEEDED